MFFGKVALASARVDKMNAILYWNDHSGIEQVANTLAHPVQGQFTPGLANVPFARDSKNYPFNGLYENGLARKKTDVMCILHFFQAIQKGGRIVAIVSEGFLCGIEREDARRVLDRLFDVRLVVKFDKSKPYYFDQKYLIY